MNTLQERRKRLRITFISENEVGKLFTPPITLWEFDRRDTVCTTRIKHYFIGIKKHYRISDVLIAIGRETTM